MGLPKNIFEPYDRHGAAADNILEDTARTYGRQLVNVANKDQAAANGQGP